MTAFTPFAIFLVVVILWSLAGYWLIATDRIYRITAKVRPEWLARWVEFLLEGPAWWCVEVGFKLINRDRPDRD